MIICACALLMACRLLQCSNEHNIYFLANIHLTTLCTQMCLIMLS
jgi:hypothetical protein